MFKNGTRLYCLNLHFDLEYFINNISDWSKQNICLQSNGSGSKDFKSLILHLDLLPLNNIKNIVSIF